MILADEFFQPARQMGFNFISGVPCSFLTPLINFVLSEKDLKYVGATNEGEAIAISAGAWLAGRKPIVMCQNSGLGNTVNPLTSLNYPFKIPCLLIVTWRGQPGIKDEPQHNLMGEITPNILDLMNIEHRIFPKYSSDISKTLKEADEYMERNSLPFALIMEKNSVQDDGLFQKPTNFSERTYEQNILEGESFLSRETALRAVLELISQSTVLVATTGKTGRELFTIDDRPQNFYMVGSMGCASAIGLGVAINTPKKVLVIDGDGAALMKMGNMATVGNYRPKNYIHILLDNGVHDSTGGQNTVSKNIDFSNIALACGYSSASFCNTVENLKLAIEKTDYSDGPHMIHVKILPGSLEKLGRPTVSPCDVAKRLKNFITE
tara:strand:+ start:59324 stop:60460 length:1137 start_codon:yes stop_codon:yes gene_type:complete